ncbi:MAG: autotransporter domain-containing protein [Verrucomicrobiales bacterium]|nr:autotransporter domain-containing protein [Verrucomicrobiales bacterium]
MKQQHSLTTEMTTRKTHLRIFALSTVLMGLLGARGVASAGETSWATNATGSWFVPAHWSAGVPSAADDAIMSHSSRPTAIVQGPSAATAANLYIHQGSVMVGNIDPGKLEVAGEIAIGTVGTPGTLTFNYGTVSVNTLSVGTAGTYTDTSHGVLELTGNNPTIKMAGGVNVVVNSSITGTNGLIKGGIGTLTLAGNNSYTGDTIISIGTLQVGNGGTSGLLGAGAISNAGTLAFNRSDTLVVSNLITGPGTLRQSGSGTVVLTANNTYSGLTVISNGTLQVGNGGTNGWVGSGNINNYGTFAVYRSDDVQLDNLMTGTGGLKQLGPGKLVLTADNTYSGTTVISNGTLQVGNGGNTGSLGTGTINNYRTLVYNRSDDVEVNNLISGTGTFVQAGSGTVTLTANNTYSGGTIISNGILQVGNGGNSGAVGSGPIQNEGVFNLNRSDTLTLAGPISGSGKVAQLGTGTVIFTGTNSYSGLTVISNGTLQIGNGGRTGTIGTGQVENHGKLAVKRSDSLVLSNLVTGTGMLEQSGSGTLILTADNTYSGGTLINAGALQVGDGGTTGSFGTGNVTNNATLIFNRADELLVQNAISGDGMLVQAGPGTVILTGSNNYSGLTLITNGVLQVGAGGTAGSLGTGSVSNNTVLVFNRADDIVVSNLISGHGNLVHIGGGVLTLTANNTYSGITAITNGTLQVGNGGFSGTISTNEVHNYGALVFNRSNAIVVLSPISGSGSVRHAGAGQLTLAGTNTFTGGLVVDGGGLIIARNGASLGNGNFELLNGTLQADTSLTNGLTIYIGSNYVQGANGTVVFRIGAQTNLDQLIVAGDVSLSGTGRVAAIAGYKPHPNDALQLIVATGTVSGTFTLFTNEIKSSPLLKSELNYGTNDVTLKWAQQSFFNYLTNEGVDLTPNQKAVAHGLDSIASSTDSNHVKLLAHLDYLPNLTNDLPASFDLIAPEELTALFSIPFADMEMHGDRFLRRLSELRVNYNRIYADILNTYYPSGHQSGQQGTNQAQTFSTPEDKLWNIYAEMAGGTGDVGDGPGSGGYDLDNRNIVIGAERRLGEQFVVGVAASYGAGKADLTGGGEIESENIGCQLYGAWLRWPWYVGGMLGGAFNSYDTSRKSLDGMAKGDTEGFSWTAMLNGGYDLQYGNWTLGPQASVQYISASFDSFTETGSLAPLQIESDTADALRTQLGGRIRYTHNFEHTLTLLMPELYVAWRHDFLDQQFEIESRFTGGAGTPFTVQGPTQGRDSLVAGLGLTVQWNPSVNTYLTFATQLGRGGYSMSTLNLGVCVSF